MAQIFPEWMNETPKLGAIATLVLGSVGTFALFYYGSPQHTDVGYKPVQPVAYSHTLHAGTLQMDCRYCHAYVERGPSAGVPPTQTCMNCHAQVLKDSPLLEPVRASWAEGKGEKSIRWVRIHKLPDFAFFDHSAHMGVGVAESRAAIGCETCHGRVDQMDVVKQVQPLSMGWCLDCHGNPAPNLRPVDQITRMGFVADLAWTEKAKAIAATLYPPGSLTRATRVGVDGKHETLASAGCSGCHR
ncbi:MAG: cytochrome c3 family protein [Deltaproteobacteria bacterium]|nr:cytochrome c3 family protein [Deltaproteobacteria bacterium]